VGKGANALLPKDKLDRLNALARKAKLGPLTAEERDEQQLLRNEYLARFRTEFRGHLDRVHVVDKDDLPSQPLH